MFPILEARLLASDVKWFKIAAPLVAKHRQPGQFVILRLGETGERIPLTIADSDARAGTIELIVKAIGATTTMLCAKGGGDTITDVMGPLGHPTEIKKVGHAVLVGGGVGTAVIYPLAKALRDIGNYVTSITGGRTKELVVLEEELAKVSDTVFACTDDGSHGFKGTVADKLVELMQGGDGAEDHRRDPGATGRGPSPPAGRRCHKTPVPQEAGATRPIGAVFAAGPVPMMRALAELTRPAGIKTIVSLNPIMIDGTGMCGGCRVTIDGKTKFACVDGPEFDGHDVDFKELADRLTAYRPQEKIASDLLQEHQCKLEAAGQTTSAG